MVQSRSGRNITVKLFHGRDAVQCILRESEVHLGLVDESDVSFDRMVQALGQSCGCASELLREFEL